MDSDLTPGALPEPSEDEEDIVDDKDEGGGKSEDKGPAKKPAKAKAAQKPKAEKAPPKPAKPEESKGAASPPKNPPSRPAAKSEPSASGNGELFDPRNGKAKDREKFAGDVVKITQELEQAGDELAIAAVFGVWDGILGEMEERFPDLYAEVNEAAEARLAEQKGGV
jgi:hypothetical protein